MFRRIDSRRLADCERRIAALESRPPVNAEAQMVSSQIDRSVQTAGTLLGASVVATSFFGAEVALLAEHNILAGVNRVALIVAFVAVSVSAVFATLTIFRIVDRPAPPFFLR